MVSFDSEHSQACWWLEEFLRQLLWKKSKWFTLQGYGSRAGWAMELCFTEEKVEASSEVVVATLFVYKAGFDFF